MPRYPGVSPAVAAMPSSIYSALAHRLAQHAGETWPFHVGDTWMEPAPGCRMEDLTVADHPGMHRYAPIQGLPALIDAVVERVSERTGVPTERDQVLVTAGATGGLGAVVGGIVAPGDEVLLLAPYWPLIAGIVRSFSATPVPVPLFCDRTPTAAEARAALEAALTTRTAAVYVNTPNNPSGRVVPPEVIEAVAAFARDHGLWVVADEVYEDYVYAGAHTYARSLLPDRTFAAYSFSKAYGMAGNRAGYVVGPSDGMAQVRKVSTHTFYATPTASQLAALRALRDAGPWVEAARAQYAETGRRAAERLGVPAPEGSTFLFLDVADRLGPGGMGAFLEQCVEHGILMAPGASFGPYPTHVRMCFTAAPPDRTLRGVEVLARLLGR